MPGDFCHKTQIQFSLSSIGLAFPCFFDFGV